MSDRAADVSAALARWHAAIAARDAAPLPSLIADFTVLVRPSLQAVIEGRAAELARAR